MFMKTKKSRSFGVCNVTWLKKLGPLILYILQAKPLRAGNFNLLAEARYEAKKLQHGSHAVSNLHVGKANLAEVFQLERLWHIVGCDFRS